MVAPLTATDADRVVAAAGCCTASALALGVFLQERADGDVALVRRLIAVLDLLYLLMVRPAGTA